MGISMGQYWRLLRTYIRSQKRLVAVLAAMLAGGIAMQLVNPQVAKLFIDTAADGSAGTGVLLRMALLFIAIAVAGQVVQTLSGYIGEKVGWTATNELRNVLAGHCLGLDMAFHKERTPGEMIQRIDGDVNALNSFFSSLVLVLMTNVALLLSVLTLLYLVGWPFGVGMTAFVLFSLFLLHRIRLFVGPQFVRLSEATAKFYGFIGECLNGTEDMRANGANGYVMRRFYGLLRAMFPLTLRSGLSGYTMWMSTIVIFALGRSLAFVLCAFLWSKGDITVGTVYLVFAYTELLNRPLEQIRMQIQELQRADASITRVSELLRMQPRIADPKQPVSLPAGALPVKFDGVSFGYEDDANVLADIDLHVGESKSLGIVGRTGSGKSTLARLLLRLYDANAGSIRIGGIDIRDVALRQLRRRVGLVTQDVQLFHGTVRDNLSLFDPSIQDDDIYRVLADLGLQHWVDSLPDRLDTVLASGGGALSAGEAQLLSLARAFLADPGLVIMDEATSRLDPATERQIEAAIGRLLGGRTAIVIAHRLSTLERVDHIAVIESGGIVEYGERTKLASDPNTRYYRLLQTGLEVLV